MGRVFHLDKQGPPRLLWAKVLYTNRNLPLLELFALCRCKAMGGTRIPVSLVAKRDTNSSGLRTGALPDSETCEAQELRNPQRPGCDVYLC